jgi:peptidoglycan/LPS O-acetylase OafA/YrhL
MELQPILNADFYIQRFKKIFPSLILVLLTVVVLSFISSDKNNLKVVLQTTASTAVCGSNIYLQIYERDIP